MAYNVWGVGSEQYPFLGTTAEGLHFYRPRQSTVNTSGMLGVATSESATYVPGAVNTVLYQAVAFDQLGNIESFQSPTQDLIAKVQTDFVFFQPISFSNNPTSMSTARESGFVWVEMDGANYEIHYRTATHTPWNIEWTYNAATGTTAAPEPIVLTGVEQTLVSGIVDISEVQTTQHLSDDTVSGNRDILLAWETENAGGTTVDVSAHRFLSTGASGGPEFLLFDDLAIDRSWSILNARSGAEFRVAHEDRNGTNANVVIRELTGAGVTSGTVTYNIAPGGGATAITDISALQVRHVSGGTNTVLVFLALETVGGNPAVVVRADMIDASGAVLGSNRYATTFISLADAGSAVLSSGFSGGTRAALGYQDSANHWTVVVYDTTIYTQVDTFGGDGLFDRIVPSRTNVDRLTVYTRDSTSAANELDFVIFDTRTVGGTFTGTAGTDVLSGSAFADTMTGGDNDDKLAGGAGDDNIDGGNGRDMLDGWAGNDTIIGGAGNDVIDGGAGADGMTGGTDNDTYYVDNAGDVIVEVAGQGVDDVITSLNTYTMQSMAGLENLRFEGIGTFNGTGNDNNNVIDGSDGANTLFGLGGSDRLSAGDAADFLYGGDGIDTLYGGGGADFLVGGLGADVLDGGDGLDTANYYGGGSGVVVNLATSGTAGDAAGDTYISIEQLWGTESADTVTGGTVGETLYGFGGNDSLTGAAGFDNLYGGNDNDTLDGGDGNDSLVGDAGNDSLTGGALNDVAYGGSGHDTINGGVGIDYLDGGSEDDSIDGGAENDALLGQAGNDTLNGDGGDDYLLGGAGIDLMSGGDGIDAMFGGDDGDIMSGGLGADYLVGEAGADSISGNEADDGLLGGLGNDTLSGGTGTDYIVAGDGDDVVYGNASGVTTGDSGNYLFGEAGLDQITGANAADYADGGGDNDTITMHGGDDVALGGTGDDSISGGTENDLLLGEGGGDTMSGDGGNDRLEGAAGNDNLSGADNTDYLFGEDDNNSLDGGADTDLLYGGNGSDELNGGLGGDYMRGDAGADDFNFSVSWGSDVILDWENGLDQMDFTAIAATYGVHATADFDFFGQIGGDFVIGEAGNFITLQGFNGGAAGTNFAAGSFIFA